MDFLYEYKGKKYEIINKGKMKIGGLWLDCIICNSCDQPLPYPYVREEKEFYEKFKPLKDKQ